MNQMNLPSFNPLNIVAQGNKIQHPTTGYSKTISQNVEDMHRDFTAHHKNLKNMVMLYRTRHQLMESLNENGLYTAKCYNEMFGGITPLSSIVNPGKKHKRDTEAKLKSTDSPTVVENATSFEESVFVANSPSQSKPFQERLASIEKEDDIDMIEYPDSGVIREKMDPDEGSRIARDVSKNIHAQEPEGMKASKNMSVTASDPSFPALVADGIKDQVEVKDTKKDPPSAASVSSAFVAGEYKRRESADPPSRKAFPDDETDLSVEKNPENDHTANVAINDKGGSVNVIVDNDDDSFTGGNEVLAIEDGKDKDNKIVINDEDQKLEKAVVVIEDKVEELLNKNVDEEEQEDAQLPVISIAGPSTEDLPINEDTPPSESTSTTSDEKNDKGDKDYLNISNDGDLVVMTITPEPKSQQEETPPKKATPNCSYFDIHKARYKETNSKLNEHSDLVQYVEEWEQTILTRVQSRYFEYVKHRTSLNHYNKKVESLIQEEEKLREKNKPIKPKQQEKFERNQQKLTGARETHDCAGESLIMLMDEVILRSWRDAFPLLKKSISFEVDYAAIQQRHMVDLVGSLELLEVIGNEESISADGRLEMFQKMNPEDIYTGARDKLFPRDS